MNKLEIVMPVDPQTPYIIWVDDRFFVSEPDIDKFGSHETLVSKGRIEAVLSGQIKKQSKIDKIFSKIRQFCMENSIGFYMANFEIDSKYIANCLAKHSIFLVDVSNQLAHPSVSDVYGFIFCNDNNITPSNRRFLTRHGANEELFDADVAQRLIHPPNIDEAIPFAEDKVYEALCGWRLLNLLHDDPHIRDAVRFYSKPWIDSNYSCWPHGDSDSDTDPHRKMLANWLGVKVNIVDILSYKALLMYSCIDMTQLNRCNKFKCKFGYTNYAGYKIKGSVLSAFFNKVGVHVIGIDVAQQYGLPVNPGISYLLSVSYLAKKLNINTPTLTWNVSKDNDTFPYIYTIDIATMEETAGLQKKDDGHYGDLRSLIECSIKGKVNLNYDLQNNGDDAHEWVRVFSGLDQGIVECDYPENKFIVQHKWRSKHGPLLEPAQGES